MCYTIKKMLYKSSECQREEKYKNMTLYKVLAESPEGFTVALSAKLNEFYNIIEPKIEAIGNTTFFISVDDKKQLLRDFMDFCISCTNNYPDAYDKKDDSVMPESMWRDNVDIYSWILTIHDSDGETSDIYHINDSKYGAMGKMFNFIKNDADDEIWEYGSEEFNDIETIRKDVEYYGYNVYADHHIDYTLIRSDAIPAA